MKEPSEEFWEQIVKDFEEANPKWRNKAGLPDYGYKLAEYAVSKVQSLQNEKEEIRKDLLTAIEIMSDEQVQELYKRTQK